MKNFLINLPQLDKYEQTVVFVGIMCFFILLAALIEQYKSRPDSSQNKDN